jgi:hypothetical protein
MNERMTLDDVLGRLQAENALALEEVTQPGLIKGGLVQHVYWDCHEWVPYPPKN